MNSKELRNAMEEIMKDSLDALDKEIELQVKEEKEKKIIKWENWNNGFMVGLILGMLMTFLFTISLI